MWVPQIPLLLKHISDTERFFTQIYNHINDKLVGLLLRARKHKLLDFEGEVLFQVYDTTVDT